MRVGVPTEIKLQEYRVGLTPSSVREYVERGHEVLIQSGAGNGIGAGDAVYQKLGARIVADAAAVYAEAELIVKIKEPQPEEWARLREGQILFTYLHLAADRAQTDGLIASGVTAIAYETVTGRTGGLPLLAPMSEVAGRLSVQAAATALQRHNGGRGILIGGVSGVPAAQLVVIGGGVVGTQAARVARGLGADTIILDRSQDRLRELDAYFDGSVKTRFSNTEAVETEVLEADAVIGAVLVPGATAPKLVSRDLVKRMKPGAVLVDVAIDQGGCFETSRPTTHAEPTFVVNGVVHYCVANMPGAVPLTASRALNHATLPYGLALAERGLQALVDDANFLNGLNVHRGMITHKAVAESLDLPLTDAREALSR